MVKKLIIHSDCEKSDKEASIEINAAMLHEEAGEVIWYSYLGSKVNEMMEATDEIASLTKKLNETFIDHHRLSNSHSNLRCSVDLTVQDLQKQITDLANKVAKLSIPSKAATSQESKSKEKSK